MKPRMESSAFRVRMARESIASATACPSTTSPSRCWLARATSAPYRRIVRPSTSQPICRAPLARRSQRSSRLIRARASHSSCARTSPAWSRNGRRSSAPPHALSSRHSNGWPSGSSMLALFAAHVRRSCSVAMRMACFCSFCLSQSRSAVRPGDSPGSARICATTTRH